MCGPLEQVAELHSMLAPRIKAGVCLDTAHAYAAGYDVSSAEGMLKFLAVAFRLFGDRALAFHVNDTRALLGSHREHHAHWGEGFLGVEGLRMLLARPEYATTVGILETPKTPGGDGRNLRYVGDVSS